ncbi:FkbM family methyltransferase [Comamonas testosteroni]|nr:FkbM family methyltransferase [Comamonas testosteroni]WQG65133.1 FkbM family methyltransferase [Comamonas testosteroni]
MNKTTDTLIPWLDHLQVLMPSKHITLVGAGNGGGAWAQWLQAQSVPMTLVEADALQFAALQRMQAAGVLAEAALLHNVVAAEAGTVEFFTANLTVESGLLSPENLRHLWPNLRTVLVEPVHAMALTQLFEVEQDHQWLILDCLPAAALLRAAQAAQHQLDVVLARVLLTEGNQQQPEGTSLAELTQALPGFALLTIKSGRHPQIAYALFVRDYLSAWEDVTQVLDQLRTTFLQNQVINSELIHAKNLQEKKYQELEASLVNVNQQLETALQAKQVALQAKKSLQDRLQKTEHDNDELLKQQELQAKVQQVLEADMAKTTQKLDAESRAKQVAIQVQNALQERLQKIEQVNVDLLTKQEMQVQAQEIFKKELKQAKEVVEKQEQEKISQLKNLDEKFKKERNSLKEEIEKNRESLDSLVKIGIGVFQKSSVSGVDIFDADKINSLLNRDIFTYSIINCNNNNNYIFFHVVNDYIPKVMVESQDFYEKSFLKIIEQLYQPGSIIVDCGANIGNHTIFFSSILNADVIAFEPQPTNYALLKSNVVLNEISHKVRIINKGVGDKKEVLRLYQAKKNNFGTFTYDKDAVGAERLGDVEYFEMEVIRMDDELSDIKNTISVIKIDIEGMELPALKGAAGLIEKHLPVISVECFSKSILDEVKKFLAKYDYFIFASENATPTFIFLSKGNVFHGELVLKNLEFLSLDKYKDKKSFNI